ncbi:MAG: division/cell wall cluster transcriptional repressor MraZ [Gammaproteobacteria bacterium]|nr:division/cell wall cluster transcriptional repressor MraZ [Gammaproteobacteria bacterium]NNM14654.1 division/cell wall cluster transcriptional repressor MraZ [Gammaproteobacteria bacterium]
MLRGASQINLDAKGRLSIPSRYRAQLQETCQGQVVITVDKDYCLLIYPFPEWEDVERKLNRLPNLNKQARRLQRLMIGYASEVEMDGNGRVLLPKELRAFAGLEKQVVLLGQGNKFELWDETRWNENRDAWLAEDDGPLEGELETLSL